MQPYYQDEWVTIYNADCRDVLPTLEKVDLVLTDPPYGIGANKMTLGNGAKRIYRGDNDWDSTPADIYWILGYGTPAVIWGGNYFDVPPARCWLVWDKGTGENDFADCELAWTNRDGVVKQFSRSWVGNNAKEPAEFRRLHPTQKPVALMRWCIEFFPDAETILDPFMGSGTTLRAAKDMNRKAIGIEIEERYCEMAAKRMSQMAMALS